MLTKHRNGRLINLSTKALEVYLSKFDLIPINGKNTKDDRIDILISYFLNRAGRQTTIFDFVSKHMIESRKLKRNTYKLLLFPFHSCEVYVSMPLFCNTFFFFFWLISQLFHSHSY